MNEIKYKINHIKYDIEKWLVEHTEYGRRHIKGYEHFAINSTAQFVLIHKIKQCTNIKQAKELIEDFYNNRGY
jgi:hypothetical protein